MTGSQIPIQQPVPNGIPDPSANQGAQPVDPVADLARTYAQNGQRIPDDLAAQHQPTDSTLREAQAQQNTSDAAQTKIETARNSAPAYDPTITNYVDSTIRDAQAQDQAQASENNKSLANSNKIEQGRIDAANKKLTTALASAQAPISPAQPIGAQVPSVTVSGPTTSPTAGQGVANPTPQPTFQDMLKGIDWSKAGQNAKGFLGGLASLVEGFGTGYTHSTIPTNLEQKVAYDRDMTKFNAQLTYAKALADMQTKAEMEREQFAQGQESARQKSALASSEKEAALNRALQQTLLNEEIPYRYMGAAGGNINGVTVYPPRFGFGTPQGATPGASK